jgi:large subunit ribosomal protein L3
MSGASSPSKVLKNKKLPGRMGNVRVTVQNLEVVGVDAERNLLMIKGAVPGPRGNMLIIKETVKS